MSFTAAEREALDMVRAGAERLGLTAEASSEDFPCKTWVGSDDPERSERRFTILEAVEEQKDFAPVELLWVEDYGFEVASRTDDAIFFERGDRRAAVQRSAPGPAGERNVWVEATTGCFPAAELADEQGSAAPASPGPPQGRKP